MKPALRALLVMLSFFPAAALRAQVINTFAGTPMAFGLSGLGGAATSAVIGQPFNVVVDNTGNVFFTDPEHNFVFKVNSAGIISTYAGTGAKGHTGDGGPATNAQIFSPYWLTLDNAGNLYVGENTGSVRIINASGIISTLISPANANSKTSTGDGGPLSAATFEQITRFVPDNAGNFYISDFMTGVVRKVNGAGIISTIAGTGIPGYSGDGGPATSAQLRNPYGVAFDNAGNVYIPDVGNNRVRKIDAAGIITTVAGSGIVGYSGDGGPATNASFYGPWQVVFDASGNMYIGDAANNCVRKVNNAGIISTYAGVGGSESYGYGGDGGPATSADMRTVASIAIDNLGNLYIVDQVNDIVRKVNTCLLPQIIQPPVNTGICAGGNMILTLTATGSTGLQWQVNAGGQWDDLSDGGAYGGTTANNLTIAAATKSINNTQYRCSITNACGTVFTAPAVLSIDTPSTPAVTITTASTTVCLGTTANFTASATNGGASPAYQWLVNGSPTGTGGPVYNSGSLNDGDAISCVLTSDVGCATTPTAISNTILEQVISPLSSSVSIASPTETICSGASVSFTATPVNGGTSPVYQWQINGSVAETGKSVFTTNDLANGDVVSCIMTGSVGCIAPTASQNQLVMTVNANPTVAVIPDTIIEPGQSVVLKTEVTGPVTNFQWTPAAGLDNPNSAAPAASPVNTTTYEVVASTDANCTASGKVTISVFKTVVMPGAFTPNGDGDNDVFRIPPSEPLKISAFVVYNRWGTRVFYTNNSAVGWDGSSGGRQSSTGTYVWVINYTDFTTGKQGQAKGTVILMR